MGDNKIKRFNFCIDCGRKLSRKDAKRCNSCARRYYYKIHPEKWIKKKYYCVDCNREISDNRHQRCNPCNAKNNQFTRSKWMKKNNPMKNKHHTEKTKEKIRNSNYHKNLAGENNPRFGKLAHGKGSYYKNIYMRSSWETLFAQFLDLSGHNWLYESKTFDLGNTTYTPDFYILEFDCYIEIKGWWRDDAKKKFNLFKKLYSEVKIKVLKYKDLQKLGVLK